MTPEEIVAHALGGPSPTRWDIADAETGLAALRDAGYRIVKQRRFDGWDNATEKPCTFWVDLEDAS